MITFDFCGQHGKDGITYQTAIKRDGNPGESGTDGRNLYLLMRTHENQIILTEEVNKANNCALILGNEQNKVTLLSNGGNGGNGSYGLAGKDGRNGYSGRDATASSNATSGTNGEDGGDGGDGGAGGNGGKGGTINVAVDIKDTDLLMIIEQAQISGGKAGTGGQGGKGGKGGYGGAGGRGYTETVHYGNNQSKTIDRPSASGGYNGADGKRGRNGTPGQPGQFGHFYYLVNGQPFKDRYNIKIDKVEQVVSLDNIIEPGEIMQIRYLTLQNIGGMNTPLYQGITLSIKQNEWIHFIPEFQSRIGTSIGIGQIAPIQHPLKFQIKDYLIPTVDQVFKSCAKVQYCAKVERVNKEFQQVNAQSNLYQIRFPVEITSAQYQKSITLNEESPFAISICNRSSEAIGFETLNKRLLNLRLMLLDTNQTVEFVPKLENDENKNNRNNCEQGKRALTQRNFVNPFLRDDQNLLLEQEFIGGLAPNSVYTISGTIKIKDFNLPAFTKINMQAKLDLGYYHDQQNTFQNIQIRNFQIQLSESYKYNPNSDFLLVVNCHTPSSLINSFKDFAFQYGSGVDIWNISNYQGFSFEYVVKSEDKTFAQLYKNKVVIILSNEYEYKTNQYTNSVKQIQEQSIYKAAKDYGIGVYILGPVNKYNQFWLTHPVINTQTSVPITFTKQEQFYQQFQSEIENKNIQKQDIEAQAKKSKGNYDINSFNYNVKESFSFCSQPTLKGMEEKSKTILKKIQQINPRYNHQVQFDFNPKVVKKNTISTDYTVGNIIFIESLKKDQASIVIRKLDIIFENSFVEKKDKYFMLKLLPFEKKLEYFGRNLTNSENSTLILQTILSDLCDEYSAFKTLKQNTLELQKSLLMWNQFLLYPFEEKLTESSLQECKKFRDNLYQALINQNQTVITKKDSDPEPTLTNPEPLPNNPEPTPIIPQIIQVKAVQPEETPQNYVCEADDKGETKTCHQPPSFDKEEIPQQNGNEENQAVSNDQCNNQQQQNDNNQNNTQNDNQLNNTQTITEQNNNQQKNNCNNQYNQMFFTSQADERSGLKSSNKQPMENEMININFQQQQQQSSTLPTVNMLMNQSLNQSDNLILKNLKEFLINSLISFQITLNKQLSIGDVCCCSVTKKVNQHCMTVLESIFKKLNVDPKEKSKINSRYEKQFINATKVILFNGFSVPHQNFGKPNDQILQSNLEDYSSPILVDKLQLINFNKDQKYKIQEGAFNFIHSETKQLDLLKRKSTIEQFERFIQYEKD